MLFRAFCRSAALVLVGFVGFVGCGAEVEDGGELTSGLRSDACTAGARAVCQCASLKEGTYLCPSSGIRPRDPKTGVFDCQCEVGPTPPANREIPAEPPAPTPTPTDPPEPTSPKNTAGDTCASLSSFRTLEVTKGSPLLFGMDLGGMTDNFKSGCQRADGPDRIQPILAQSSGTMTVRVVGKTSYVGPAVLYAKATCDATMDLACSLPMTEQIELAVKQGVVYFVHFDGTSPTQPSAAKLNALAEIR
jgi:hypothetical protein